MGLLHNLWDETVAGPAPEAGLEELPEHRSAAAAGRSAAAAAAAAVLPRGAGLVSRRITFVRTGTLGGAVGWDSVPETPPRPVVTRELPHLPVRSRGFQKFTRRKSSEALQKAEPRSPTAFDWILISALDR
ncbi:dormancy-associated protein homolog 3 [Eucalyptus grandis]|uniref:dormancy-associated protein homolog 3 n=1 Tax=Eucalyptus grandis TaxID=71139 RepID=UPI00192EE5B8|nr:dormancy-associated protein homolog 3 [Eucalyptus grandis]